MNITRNYTCTKGLFPKFNIMRIDNRVNYRMVYTVHKALHNQMPAYTVKPLNNGHPIQTFWAYLGIQLIEIDVLSKCTSVAC